MVNIMLTVGRYPIEIIYKFEVEWLVQKLKKVCIVLDLFECLKYKRVDSELLLLNYPFFANMFHLKKHIFLTKI
ncbi:hypothetical protein bcgnr5378_06280 [Bacillus cereus]